MPERIKGRAEIAEALLGLTPGALHALSGYSGAPPNRVTPSVGLRALEIADLMWRIMAEQDLQRVLLVARATHEYGCLAPEPERQAEHDCCGWCLRAALLDCSDFNKGAVQDTSHPLRGEARDERWLEQRRHAALLEEAQPGWQPPEDLNPLTEDLGQPEGESSPPRPAGLAEELTLLRAAQRSGTALLIQGPAGSRAQLKWRQGLSPDACGVRGAISAGLDDAADQLQAGEREIEKRRAADNARDTAMESPQTAADAAKQHSGVEEP